MAPSPTESAFHNRKLRQWRLQVIPAVSAEAGSPGSSSGVGCGSPISLVSSVSPVSPVGSVSPVGYSPAPRLPDSILRQPAESASRKGKGVRQICNLPPYRPHHEIHLRAPSPFHLRQTPLHGAGETFSLTPAPPVPPLRILLHIRRAGEFHEVTEIFTNCL